MRTDIVTADELLNLGEAGTITAVGLRTNIAVALEYIEAWIRGNGCKKYFFGFVIERTWVFFLNSNQTHQNLDKLRVELLALLLFRKNDAFFFFAIQVKCNIWPHFKQHVK